MGEQLTVHLEEGKTTRIGERSAAKREQQGINVSPSPWWMSVFPMLETCCQPRWMASHVGNAIPRATNLEGSRRGSSGNRFEPNLGWFVFRF